MNVSKTGVGSMSVCPEVCVDAQHGHNRKAVSFGGCSVHIAEGSSGDKGEASVT